MKTRGTIIVELLVVAGAGLLIGVVAGGWKPAEWFRPKPPTTELTVLQGRLTDAEARLKEAEITAEAARQAERAKQEQQIRHAQQMQSGASEAIRRQPPEHRTPQTALASDLLNRSEFAFGLAIGNLSPDLRAEIVKIVDGALSSVQAERDAAAAALLAKDAELKVVSRERDAIKAELPRLAAQVAQAEQKAEAIKTQVATKIDEVKAVANTLDAERRKAGSLAAQLDKLWRIAFWLGAAWLFFAFVLPVIVKALPSGAPKNALRDVAGFLSSPALYIDAKRKLSDLQP